MTIERFAAAASSMSAWVFALAAAAILIAWNGGRNLASAALFLGSVVPALLIAASLPLVLPDVRPPASWVGIAELTLLSTAFVLLSVCGLITAGSLLARTPFGNLRGVVTLLILGYAPVVALIAIWAIVFVVLAMIGF